MAIVNDDGVHEDEFESTVQTLPPDIKRVYITAKEDAAKPAEETPTEAPDASNAITGILPTLQSNVSPGILPKVFPDTPERPPAKVMYTLKSGLTITDHDIEDATNVAMGTGPAMIAGVGSKTASSATRWFQGTDGKMKYEISDEGMKLADRDWKYGETGKLGDFVEHPKLYEAYPDLKDINFKVAEKDYKYLGSYNDASKTLTMNPRMIRAGDEGLLDVLTHEIQHIIQSKEGFATGSNPDKALGKAILAAMKVKDDGLVNDIIKKAKDFAEYMYLRTPGEVEANMTSARRKLSDELREMFPIQEHQKMIEGEINSTHGGKYLPEFHYPKNTK